ncbi:hypothetical protein D3C84_1051700 [compost metagenome]
MDGDRGLEGQHGDEVHGPDAAAQAQGADPAPVASGLGTFGMGHTIGDAQGGVAGGAGHHIGQQHQAEYM